MSVLEQPSVFRVERHRCRRPVPCWLCHHSITIASHYVRVSGIWDGQWDVLRYHPSCWGLVLSTSTLLLARGEPWEDATPLDPFEIIESLDSMGIKAEATGPGLWELRRPARGRR